MRSLLRLLPVTLFLLTVHLASAQSFSFNCTADTSINLCNTVQCLAIKAKIPDLKGLSDSYKVNPITTSSSSCFPVYSQPDDPGGSPTNLTIDDRYTGVIPIGFDFPFFGTTYTKLVASTNGYLSFDTLRAGQSSHYEILSNAGILSSTAGTPLDVPSVLYDRALIMGPYHDINPALTTSPNQRIQYITVGTAPYRKWILSFFKVPLYNCNSLIENTHQIILYESTGIIEVTLFSKQICPSWNQGRAMIGLQNFNRDQGIVVPGRAASSTPWGGLNMNESYRFVPSSGTSLFKRVELYDMAGALVNAGTAVAAGDGTLDVTFPAMCNIPMGTTSYVIKSVYNKIDDPTVEVFGLDTVRVTRSTSTELNATAGTTPSACGPNGSITVTVPNGVGVPPFQYKLDANPAVTDSNKTYTFTGVLGGSHTVVVTDAAGCSSTLRVNVPSSGLLNAAAPTSTGTTCAGASNGSITAGIPTNGFSPFGYSLDNASWQSSNVFNNLAPGTYTVYIRDNSGCVSTPVSIAVGQGPAMTTTATGVPPSCNGATNGSITVTPPASGIAPFQYNLNNGVIVQSNNVFSNLAPGTYFVKVTDAQGCVTASIDVIVPNGSGNLTATATSAATSCSGVNNGTITINPTSGSGPYQYSINSSPFQNGTTINNLAPGTYSIIVKDNAGCVSAPISVTVAQGNALLATATSTATSCTGVNNGSITVTPTNGSAPYTYQLNGGPSQSSNIFNGVSAGNHAIVVTDGAGCVSAPIPVTVAVGPAITGTTTSVATTCNGASDGMITVSPTTGTAPYQYSIDGGAFQNSNLFTGLTSGNHTVIIKDAAGCTSPSISVNVTAGAPLSGSAVSTSTSCSGATDGTIIATFNGSATDLINLQPKFSLNGGPFQASGTFISVSAGNHTIVINSINGCVSAPIPVTVTTGLALTATVATTPTSCSGAINGTITVTPANGTGPFQYSIDGVNFQPSNTFTGLATGNYTISFRNISGCQSTIAATVSPGQPLTATAVTGNVLCNGGNTGTVTVSISSNGAPPYQYSLNGVNWQTSNLFSGLTAGNYNVQFKDNNNCSGSQSFVIAEPSALTISPALQSVLCSGQSNGRIVVAATGGTAPYQYSLNGTNYQTNNSFNVPAGTYTVYARDTNGCIKTQSVTINEPAVLAATATTIGASCDGLGSISVNANGGSGSYQYSVDGINFQASNVLNVSPGNYTVTIKDVNGCILTINATVGLINNLTITPITDETICEGTSVQLKPNTNGTQFSWTGIGLNANNIQQPVASPTITTQYIVTATLGVCSVNDSITVNILPAPIANAGNDGDICFGQTYQLQGSGGVSYQWSPSTYLNTSLNNNPVSTPAQTIQYALTVVGANGCQSLQPDVVRVNVTPPIVIQVTKDTVVAFGDVFQLQASSVATNYVWSPGFGLSNAFDAKPIVTVTGDITYTVTATTAAGCKGDASVTLKVYKGPEIYVPTAFTPNGDGKNDMFKPFPVGIKNYTYFRIYNRWGQVIFSTSEFNKGWDGTISGKQQPTGTYVWVVEGFTKEGKKISKKGTITLIR